MRLLSQNDAFSFGADGDIGDWAADRLLDEQHVFLRSRRQLLPRSHAGDVTAPAIHIVDHRARIRERYIAAYRERIFYSTERLEKLPYLSLVAPKGTFYLFPGVEKTGLSSGEFCKALLERAHILVSPGDVFGIAGKQHFRIACTVNIDKLREAYDRMEALSF